MERIGNVVFKPESPYVGVIPDGLEFGKSVIVRGVVTGSQNNFAVNFSTGLLVDGEQKNDVALHINPRFYGSPHEIVLNTLVDNVWGKEVLCRNPIEKGDPMEIRVLVTPKGYNIAVNGKSLAVFPHRLALSSVKTLFIKGCLQIEVIQFCDAKPAEPSAPTEGQLDEANAKLERLSWAVSKPTVPFIRNLIPPLQSGQQLYITGKPFKNASRFEINFKSKEDIAFHFNVRFNDKYYEGSKLVSRKHVVRNCYRRKKWETEESDGPEFPFIPSGTFDIVFLIDDNGFQVAVNGQHFIFFSHRIPFSDLDELVIEGDLTLQQIRLV